jgi:hypothetical protein
MSKYLFKISKNRLKTIQYNPLMTSQNVTLRQLIAFQPENDREKEIYNINHDIINNMNKDLQDNRYYLGGQIKMGYDDEINLDSFDKVREIDRKREAEYGCAFNSWEYISINYHRKTLEETEAILKKYFEIIFSRENS